MRNSLTSDLIPSGSDLSGVSLGFSNESTVNTLSSPASKFQHWVGLGRRVTARTMTSLSPYQISGLQIPWVVRVAVDEGLK